MGYYWQGKLKYSEKTWTTTTLPVMNLPRSDLGLNPGFIGDASVPSRPSLGTTSEAWTVVYKIGYSLLYHLALSLNWISKIEITWNKLEGFNIQNRVNDWLFFYLMTLLYVSSLCGVRIITCENMHTRKRSSFNSRQCFWKSVRRKPRVPQNIFRGFRGKQWNKYITSLK